MSTRTEPVIELADVSKTFRPVGRPAVEAVQHVDLQIGRGEIVAFLGPNGAGKTTTLDMVLGLTEPTSGTIEVYGRSPRAAVLAGNVSAVLQTGGLLHDLSVRETVQVVASTYQEAQPVEEVLDRAGLTAIAKRRVSKCSGGEQQRLRFALALLPNPDLLILDEPTAGMDVGARHEFWATMRAEVSTGRTVVFATHYLEEADTFAERIVMIARGQVVADGPTEEIRARATGRTVAANVAVDAVGAAVAALQRREDVSGVTVNGDRVTVQTADSDAVALTLLTELGGSGLEITAGSLDDAFLTLTADTEPAVEGASR